MKIGSISVCLCVWIKKEEPEFLTHWYSGLKKRLFWVHHILLFKFKQGYMMASKKVWGSRLSISLTRLDSCWHVQKLLVSFSSDIEIDSRIFDRRCVMEIRKISTLGNCHWLLELSWLFDTVEEVLRGVSAALHRDGATVYLVRWFRQLKYLSYVNHGFGSESPRQVKLTGTTYFARGSFRLCFRV